MDHQIEWRRPIAVFSTAPAGDTLRFGQLGTGAMPAGWENFFIAEFGATAALAGLAIVAISFNLSRTRAFPELPGHAAGGMQNTRKLLAEILR